MEQRTNTHLPCYSFKALPRNLKYSNLKKKKKLEKTHVLLGCPESVTWRITTLSGHHDPYNVSPLRLFHTTLKDSGWKWEFYGLRASNLEKTYPEFFQRTILTFSDHSWISRPPHLKQSQDTGCIFASTCAGRKLCSKVVTKFLLMHAQSSGNLTRQQQATTHHIPILRTSKCLFQVPRLNWNMPYSLHKSNLWARFA